VIFPPIFYVFSTNIGLYFYILKIQNPVLKIPGFKKKTKKKTFVFMHTAKSLKTKKKIYNKENKKYIYIYIYIYIYMLF